MTQNKTISQNRHEAAGKTMWEQGNKSPVQEFVNSQDGATAIEYALIAGGISIVIIASVNLIGVNVAALFTSVQSAF